jgi:ACS family phthalate transporter-like MFS transporter
VYRRRFNTQQAAARRVLDSRDGGKQVIGSSSDRPDRSPMTGSAVYRKVAWRLMPFLLLCYIVNYIDRANVAMAYLGFEKDVGITDVQYGLGAGLFFLGYLLFEIPSNLMLERFGARITLFRIMCLWGMVTSLTMLISSPAQFYIARILLGAAEAGFVPGVILYLTYWFPKSYRAKMTALFFLAVPIGSLIGNPLAGAIMSGLDGVGQVDGWRWLFLLEGIPAIILGVVALMYLDNRVADARWLSSQEKAHILADIGRENDYKEARTTSGFADILRNPRTYVLGYVVFSSFVLGNIISFWTPRVIRDAGVSNVLNVGWLSAAPALIGSVCLVIAGWHSDRSGERRWHVAIPMMISATGLAVLPFFQNDTVMALVLLGIIVSGHYSTLPVIFSIPSDYVSRSGTAGGIALISSMGAVGGIFGPTLLGWSKQMTGDLQAGLLIAAAIIAGGAAALILGISRSVIDRT